MHHVHRPARLGPSVLISGTWYYTPISSIICRPFIKEGAYITKEPRDQSRLATLVQLDPIHVVGQASAAMYFERKTLNAKPSYDVCRRAGFLLTSRQASRRAYLIEV